MDNLKENMILTLADESKYKVVKIVEIENIKYAYIVNVDNDIDDGFITIEGDRMIVVKDDELLVKLYEAL